MRPLETTAGLAAFENRGPGTDAERRAAKWLARELVADRHRVRIESFWCRPNWALANAWHVALALAGSLLSVSHPTIGAVLLVIALISTIADATIGVSPGRRLTPERASQNVVATPRSPETDNGPTPSKATRLIVTANYDAGRTALIYRDSLRRPAAWFSRVTRGITPGWVGWLSIVIVWALAIAIIRRSQSHPASALGPLQLPPTVILVLALALLLEAAAAGYGPAANDNATGIAAAIALARALAAAPPKNLKVELLLQGAGEGQEIGMRRYLKTHKPELKQANPIVIGIAPTGGGLARWWASDGRLVPIRYSRPLRDLCARVSADHARLGAAAHPGRGATPAFPARTKRLPAIAIGALDPQGVAPHSHQPGDTIESLDSQAITRTAEFGLLLAHAIDRAVQPDAGTPRKDPTEEGQAATPA